MSEYANSQNWTGGTYTTSIPTWRVGNVIIGGSSFLGSYASNEKALQIQGSVNSWLNLRPTGSSKWFEIGVGDASGSAVLYAHSTPLTLWADGTRMTIDNVTGKVGIGTTAPAELLHLNGSIRGNISGALRISSGNGYVDVGPMNPSWAHFQTDRPRYYFNTGLTVDSGQIGSYDEDLILQTSGVNRLFVSNTTGNIGLSTLPHATYRLDVNGSINATSLYVNGTPVSGGTSQWTTTGSNIYYNAGNVAIGTSTISSTTKFEVVGPGSGNGATIRASGGGDVLLNSGGSLFFDGNYSYGAGNYIRPVAANTQAFFTSGIERMRIASDGNIGIGTTLSSNPNGYKLAVNGVIGAKEVKVENTSTTWPDYVFNSDYKLSPLSEVEHFIKENNHLPEVPTASEIKEKGQALGEMNALLLKKVEELTLYLIDIKKEVNELKTENKSLRKELESIKEN